MQKTWTNISDLVKTQVRSPLLRSNLNLKLFVEDEESMELERKKRE
jgi:hypothetical protein